MAFTFMQVSPMRQVQLFSASFCRLQRDKWGTVEDLVAPSLFLASQPAKFVTGVVVPDKQV